LRGKRYEMEKKIWGGTGSNQHIKEQRGQNEPSAKTYDVIAEEYSVSPSTVKRNANFAKVVDILPEEVKHDVLSGEEKISRTMTDAILDFDKPTQKKFLKEVQVIYPSF
jgi:hypothetical protein